MKQAPAAMRRPSARAFIAVTVAIPLAFGLLTLGLWNEFQRSESLRRAAADSFDRRIAAVALLSELKDAETAQRGFILTGDETFLEPYAPSRREIIDYLHRMDRPEQHGADPWMHTLHILVESKFEELDRTIALVRAGREDQARAIVREGAGKRVMDRLRDVVATIVRDDRAVADAALQRFLAQRQRLARGILGSVVVLTLLSLAVLAMIWRARVQRHAALVRAVDAAERNATIFDATIDALLILNPSGTVEMMNPAATRMLGYEPGELERRDIATVIDIAPGSGSFHSRVGLIDGRLRRPFLTDRTAHHRDGRGIAVDVALGVMDLPRGRHVIVSLRDVSERKRLEQVKDDLISTVSHELRTPLTSVIGSLGLLRAGTSGTLPPQAQRLVDIAENNSRRLIRLINDMLDIDRIETERLRLASERIDLRDVMQRACIGSEGLARERHIRLNCAEVPAPVPVIGDADRLLQVVTNLLSNATRVSPEGAAVDIAVALTPDGADGGVRAILTVEDRGPGIAPAFRERIFGRFERADARDTATGAGLGLAISREIVRRHGGDIRFEDRDGGGTRFVVELPPAPADDGAADPAAPRILLCEADDAAAAALAQVIAVEGCVQDRVATLAEALAAIRGRRYDAALVALALPGGGGIELVRQARADTTLAAPAAILVAPEARGDEPLPASLDVVDWIDRPGANRRLTVALRTAIARAARPVPVILCLDDDADMLQVMAETLEPEVRICRAATIDQARAIVASDPPDVAVLDLHLQGASGLDLLPYLVDARGIAIPVIVHSAQDITDDAAALVDAVLVKSGESLADLKATVRRLVRARAAGAAREAGGVGRAAEEQAG
ncbi:ATP-binding protein [Sphingomonas sp. CCH9-F2]|nr:ATP-binding protein [Sphingomonas sp. CCH9-F2]